MARAPVLPFNRLSNPAGSGQPEALARGEFKKIAAPFAAASVVRKPLKAKDFSLVIDADERCR
jgi:hypothetical protein